MTREEVFIKLNDIFREEFDDEEIVLTENTTSEDIEDWDSLANVNLVVAIEKEFSMRFSMGEVSNMKNVGEMADIILQKCC